jgi:hypothetical protein
LTKEENPFISSGTLPGMHIMEMEANTSFLALAIPGKPTGGCNSSLQALQVLSTAQIVLLNSVSILAKIEIDDRFHDGKQ